MADRKLPPQKNLILAELVQSWATRNRVSKDPYVRGLVEALIESKNLAMWASIDSLSYLPHPTVNSEDGVRVFYRRLNAIRNSLVFAPVALTWLVHLINTSSSILYSAYYLMVVLSVDGPLLGYFLIEYFYLKSYLAGFTFNPKPRPSLQLALNFSQIVLI